MKNNHILWLGLILSVLLKGFFLSLDGNADMLQYRMWGDAVLDKGLADAYRGIYFPLQWQLFAICSWLARNFNFLHWTLPFKAMNLIFDIGCFWVLVLLLKRHKLNPLYALLYCLHPWFIVNFSQGFVDSQSMFFVLLPLLILRENGNTFKRYFAAGIPLACAFLMKPQIMLIIAAIGFYLVWAWYKTRCWRQFAIIIPVIVLYAAYMIYFSFSVREYTAAQNITIPGFLLLPFTYVVIGMTFPCLTASMSNMWYPIAYCLKQPGAPVYSVNYPGVTLIVSMLTVCAIIVFSVYLARKYQNALTSEALFFIVTFVSLLVPFFMTSAHCNHPFVATVALIVMLAKHHRNKVFSYAFHSMLILLFCATFARYGWGPSLPQNILPHNGFVSNTIAILIAIIFPTLFYCFVKIALSRQGGAGGGMNPLEARESVETSPPAE